MRVLNVLSSLNLNQGGPPEVVRNYSNVINRKNKIIAVMKLNMISSFYFITTFINRKRNKNIGLWR